MTPLQKWVLLVMLPWLLYWAGYVLHNRSSKKTKEKELTFRPVPCPKCNKELQYLYGLSHWICPACGYVWKLTMTHTIERDEHPMRKET